MLEVGNNFVFMKDEWSVRERSCACKLPLVEESLEPLKSSQRIKIIRNADIILQRQGLKVTDFLIDRRLVFGAFRFAVNDAEPMLVII